MFTAEGEQGVATLLYQLLCCELAFFSQSTYGHTVRSFVFSVDNLVI